MNYVVMQNILSAPRENGVEWIINGEKRYNTEKTEGKSIMDFFRKWFR